jgi:hypothetical protein
MQFSDTTNKDGCIQYIESLCRLGDGGITNDTTLFKQITSYFNQADKKVAMALLRVDKNWKFDDTKYTDFPIASINLVNNQRDYTLPASTSGGLASTLWKLTRVRVLDTSGLYYEIKPADPEKEEDPDDNTYSGKPREYRLIGNSIRLNPKPDTSVLTATAGLEITFQRSTVPFSTSSTTEEPGYMDSYHDLPCYDTASTYLLPIDRQLAIDYRTIFETRLKDLQTDWKNKDAKFKPRFISRYNNPA